MKINLQRPYMTSERLEFTSPAQPLVGSRNIYVLHCENCLSCFAQIQKNGLSSYDQRFGVDADVISLPDDVQDVKWQKTEAKYEDDGHEHLGHLPPRTDPTLHGHAARVLPHPPGATTNRCCKTNVMLLVHRPYHNTKYILTKYNFGILSEQRSLRGPLGIVHSFSPLLRYHGLRPGISDYLMWRTSNYFPMIGGTCRVIHILGGFRFWKLVEDSTLISTGPLEEVSCVIESNYSRTINMELTRKYTFAIPTGKYTPPTKRRQQRLQRELRQKSSRICEDHKGTFHLTAKPSH